MKPYAESCDQNRDAIFGVIEPLFSDRSAVLEIGSGTGQHAVYFAPRLSQLTWYASDVADNHPGITLWLEESGLDNVEGPLSLDVTQSDWPALDVDAVFSANTAHIMPWDAVESMFDGVGNLLQSGGLFVLYGPFNYNGSYTAPSNERFDQWLKERGAWMGVRDFEALNALAEKAGMRLSEDFDMPSDNHTLVWVKS